MKIKKIETNFKRNLFWKVQTVKFNGKLKNTEKGLINVYPDAKFQEIIGFGGAFTEASGYNVSKVSKTLAGQIMKDYFSEDGLAYSFCRTPIGSTDFSLSSYSYVENGNMDNFSVARDELYIIPMIKSALKINPKIKLLASPWSPPAFLKDNNKLTLGGKLRKNSYGFYAEYLTKYILEYQKRNLKMDYMTIQNEPNATQMWESCIYTAAEEAEFANQYLHPNFVKHGITTQILGWDHNKERLYERAKEIYKIAGNAVSGMAMHWYSGDYFEEVALTRNQFPNKLLIHTEGCTGFSKFKKSEEVKNGEIYAHDMIGDLNSGSNGFIDWNLVLDYQGGPNHKKNYCNAPIMLNPENSDYIKNLTYYYIGHFSKFIKPGAKKIGFSCFTTDIEVTAFQNTDSSIAIVLLNRNDFNKEFTINLNGEIYHDNLDSHAILTFLLK